MNEEDLLDNTPMPGTPNDPDSFPFEAVITINPKITASIAGAQLAKSFTAFAESRKDLFNNRAQEYSFKGVLSDESNRPLNYYLVDNDAVKLFMTLYAAGNDKDTLYNCDELLEQAFGNAINGRRLLDMYAEWG